MSDGLTIRFVKESSYGNRNEVKTLSTSTAERLVAEGVAVVAAASEQSRDNLAIQFVVDCPQGLIKDGIVVKSASVARSLVERGLAEFPA